jgi:hypothetical protein
MVKKDQVKKIKKGDVVIRFWYSLKNLHPIFSCCAKNKGMKKGR